MLLQFEAKRDLAPGEELTHNYLGHPKDLENQTKAERMQYLKQTFGFECSCTKCICSAREDHGAERVEVQTRARAKETGQGKSRKTHGERR